MIPVGQLLKVDGALAADFLALRQAVGISRRAPLSARHALHAAVLIDQLSDVAYVRRAELSFPTLATAGDILSFRAALRACDPALGPLMDLTSCGADCPRLQVVAEEVALDCFTSLPVEDLMVSLYNAGTVPRLMLVQKDMRMLPMQVLLQDATNWWSSTLSVSKMNE
jgi:hypothetical protein